MAQTTSDASFGPFFFLSAHPNSVVAVVVPVLTRSLIVNKSNIYRYIKHTKKKYLSPKRQPVGRRLGPVSHSSYRCCCRQWWWWSSESIACRSDGCDV